MKSNATTWFEDGLRFSCLKCGRCCTGDPGYVWLEEKDIVRLAEAVGKSREAFLKQYCRSVGGRISLLEHENGDCVFFNGASQCAVYHSRPSQCRLFPFWPHLLESRQRWESEMRRCPGIGRGKKYSAVEIKKM